MNEETNEWKEGYRMTGKYVAYTVAKAWDELADTAP